MTIAAYSLLGIVSGALLQFFFTRHLEHQRHVRDLKTQAYTDYMRCVCELANVGTQGGEDFAPGLDTRTADAKSRVSLYGSVDVIDAFAEFEKVGAQTASYEQCEVFGEMVMRMRADSGVKGNPNSENLISMLLGVRRE